MHISCFWLAKHENKCRYITYLAMNAIKAVESIADARHGVPNELEMPFEF